MAQHRITNSADVRTGNAISPSRDRLGVPLKNLISEIIAPAASVATALISAATGAELPNTATKTYTFPAAAVSPTDGSLSLTGTFDMPRTVLVTVTHASSIVATNGITYGYDKYGQAMQETWAVTATGTSKTAAGVKAFARVTRVDIIAAADSTANTVSIGSGVAIGLSYRPIKGGFIRGRLNEDTADSGTYTAPERTTSTATTNDTRGLYAPAGTMNGTNTYTLLYTGDNGPDDKDAFGIVQYNG